MALVASRHLTFHARGDAAFVWHGLTGDVAGMSRDVLALVLAFRTPTAEREVEAGGLTRAQIEEFVPILRSRRFLVREGADEVTPLLEGIPRVPRGAVFERLADGRVRLWTRAGTSETLDPRLSAWLLRCDGERTLAEVLGDAGADGALALLRLAQPELAALKVLARPVSQGGVQLNSAAESTMPYPQLPDPDAYVAGAPAPPQGDDKEPTFASLFATPHAALRGRTYAQAVRDELARRGTVADLLELHVGAPVLDGVAARRLTHDLVLGEESASAVVAIEPGEEHHAAIFEQALHALRPSGVLFLTDRQSESLEALAQRARELNLRPRLLPIGEALDMDLSFQALAATHASWPALRALFAARGVELATRAWLRSEVESLGVDLTNVHGLQWAPLSERTLGLSPGAHRALVLQKPDRVIH